MESQPLPRLSFNKQSIWSAKASLCEPALCAQVAQRPGTTQVRIEHHMTQVAEGQTAVRASKHPLEQTFPHYHPKHLLCVGGTSTLQSTWDLGRKTQG